MNENKEEKIHTDNSVFFNQESLSYGRRHFSVHLILVIPLIISTHFYVFAKEEIEEKKESVHQENLYTERNNLQEGHEDRHVEGIDEQLADGVRKTSEQECDNGPIKDSENCVTKSTTDISDNNDVASSLGSEKTIHKPEHNTANVGQMPSSESTQKDAANPELNVGDGVQQTQLKKFTSHSSSDQSDGKDESTKLSDGNEKSSANVTGSADDTVGNQSYFSFGNILKNLVSPVLEEFERNTDVKEIKDDTSNKSITQTNITVAVDNSTMEEIVPAANKTERKTKFTCVGKNMTLEENRTIVVNIINNTRLVNLLSFDKNETTSDCVLVLFYAPYCHFCARIGPSYNALARVFPQLEIVAVDAAQFSNLNAKFGTVSVPNIILFHQSRSAVRFNQTDKSFNNLIEFVKNSTGLNPNMTVNITEEDQIGPLPSVPVESTDYLLWLAWVFVVMCSTFMFIHSQKGQQWINKVKILWQEHQHIE